MTFCWCTYLVHSPCLILPDQHFVSVDQEYRLVRISCCFSSSISRTRNKTDLQIKMDPPQMSLPCVPFFTATSMAGHYLHIHDRSHTSRMQALSCCFCTCNDSYCQFRLAHPYGLFSPLRSSHFLSSFMYFVHGQ